MQNILVTGANGFVGSYLCTELANHGYAVRALHRKASDLSLLKGVRAEFVEGDVRDKSSLVKAMTGVDTVFHIAAVFREAKFPNSYYYEVNTKGTQNVIEAALESGVTKLVYCSTTGVHGHLKNPPANEQAPFAPRDVYQVSKCKAEELILECIRSGKLKCSIVRPAMIWGPNDKRLLKLFRGISSGVLPIIGNGKTWTHWIMIDDLVRAFRLVGESEAAVGQTFIIAGERAVSIGYVYEQIAKFFSAKLIPFKVPAFPLWLCGAAAEFLCLPFGIEPPIYRRRVEFYTKNRSFDCSKARQVLNFSPSRTFEEEVNFLASWYVNHKWIQIPV